MIYKPGLKFIWISAFGPLVEIRIKEISKRLMLRGIYPIIFTHKLKKKESLKLKHAKRNLFYYHFRNPLFFNINTRIFKYLREIVSKIAFILGGIPFLYSDIKSFIKKNADIKFIYATGPPFFTHILGYLLKKKCKKKLIVEYTDPWYKNPYSAEKRNFFEKILDYHIEKRILQSADVIISNTEFLNPILQRNFPFIKNKPIFSVGDGLNLQEFEELPQKDENGIIITYGGKIYGRRNIYPLFKIISDLNKEHFFKDIKILVKIYGFYPKKLFERILDSLKIRDLFYLGDFLSRSHFIEEIMKSDIALHIGENLDYPTIAFKVWEYLSCRKKILFLGLERSYRSDFIRNNNLGVVIPIDNLEKGKELLKDLFLKIKNKKIDLTLNEDILKKFSWDNRAEKFMKNVINSL
ncbi:MAG: hypothetical protein ACFE8M_11470 [Candidatus Hermodarchaeota archaeon]